MVIITGYSDDIISLEGDIDDEIPYNDEPVYLSFSDGTVLQVDYDARGIWRIHLVKQGNASYIKIESGKILSENYSDMVKLGSPSIGNICWVVYGEMRVPSK